ncbi:MAG TPA: ornithine cyclodeaminase family protein [Vicinamibacterales bacterium]|nr:ornithine cyclodeaminase family protein [Vicinamibacterales bacterium]
MALLLSEQDVRQLLPMSDLIDAMQDALALFSTDQVKQPVRSIVELGTHGFFGVMPAALASPAAAGMKLVTVVPANHDRGLPSHLATIVLIDHDTGALEAILDGRYITEARTAAVSAVSARHLARAGSHVVAIIGAGVQARSHADALSRVLDVSEFRIWSPTAAHREAAAKDIEKLLGPNEPDLKVRPTTGAQQAAEGADVVVLVTSAATPVIEDGWIAGGTHVIGVGACRPNQREMPAALMARARVIVDSRDAAMKEAGDILLAQQDGANVTISAELGEICAGRAPGREDDAGVTIFKSLGLAVEDVVAAHLVLQRAKAAGLGITHYLS